MVAPWLHYGCDMGALWLQYCFNMVGQSKVSLVIQNGTPHNRFSGGAIQADSVHGGVVDNQRYTLSYRIAFYIIDPVWRQFKQIL